MNIRDLRSHFFEVLDGVYPREEISSFFNILAETFLGMTRLNIALDIERELTLPEKERFENALFRLIRNEPIQYITGNTRFFGIKLKVGPDVLIPRPETEELVEWILSTTDRRKEIRILDIGTGSGCIAVALAKNLPMARVAALDISVNALAMARENAAYNGVEIEFIKMDILASKHLSGTYDLIVSNPPYVRQLEKQHMEANVIENEPGSALFVNDEDPLVFYEKIAKLASRALRGSGKLFFEINQYLPMETKAVVEEQGFQVQLRKDIFDRYRMLMGILKS